MCQAGWRGLEQAFEHLPPRSWVQGIVLDFQEQTVQDGWIDIVHAVGGEDHHALEMLQPLQEDAHQAIAFQGDGGAGLEKDIGFVQQQDGIPLVCGPEELEQLHVQLARIRAQIRTGNLVASASHQGHNQNLPYRIQWSTIVVSQRLRRQGLAYAWGSTDHCQSEW